MGALAASSFAADFPESETGVTLYSKAQGLNSHATALSERIMKFVETQKATPSQEISWLGSIGNAMSWSLRSTGNLLRQHASTGLGELAKEHIQSYLLTQQGGASSSLTEYAASWDSASIWKMAGAGLRTAGYYTTTKSDLELAVEERALYRIIFDFCKEKGIDKTGKDVLPLAATALMLCNGKIEGGFDQVITEYNLLVHKFAERSSVEPLSNAVVAIDYLIEGMCHYEVLDAAICGQQDPIAQLKNHILAWGIDPYTMLSCTACVDQTMVTQGMTPEDVKKIALGDMEEKIKKFREEKVEQLIKASCLKYANKLMQNPKFNTENMVKFKGKLENSALTQSS